MSEGRRVTIEEARRLVRQNPNISIMWRPEEALPEPDQYALIFNE